MTEDQHSQKEHSCDDEPTVDEGNTTADREHTGDQSHRNLHKKRIFGIEADRFIELCFACIVTAFTALLWWTSSNQLSAMKEQTASMQSQLASMVRQNDIAERQFHVSHRPWIEPEISIVNPLTFYSTYTEVVLSIKAKNGGTAPAIGFEPMLDLVIIGPDVEDNVLKRQNTWCSQERVDALVKTGKLHNGRLLLPNSEITYPIWKLQEGKPPIGEVTAVWITGCILYADEFGSGHATLTTLLLATSYPFKTKPGLVVKNGRWGLAPYGHGAY